MLWRKIKLVREANIKGLLGLDKGGVKKRFFGEVIDLISYIHKIPTSHISRLNSQLWLVACIVDCGGLEKQHHSVWLRLISRADH